MGRTYVEKNAWVWEKMEQEEMYLKGYEITYQGDCSIGNVHHVGVEYGGNYYSFVFGEYVNGGFFSVPNWNCGGELADFDDVSWNAESIGRAFHDKKVGMMLAEVINDIGKRGI